MTAGRTESFSINHQRFGAMPCCDLIPGNHIALSTVKLTDKAWI